MKKYIAMLICMLIAPVYIQGQENAPLIKKRSDPVLTGSKNKPSPKQEQQREILFGEPKMNNKQIDIQAIIEKKLPKEPRINGTFYTDNNDTYVNFNREGYLLDNSENKTDASGVRLHRSEFILDNDAKKEYRTIIVEEQKVDSDMDIDPMSYENFDKPFGYTSDRPDPNTGVNMAVTTNSQGELTGYDFYRVVQYDKNTARRYIFSVETETELSKQEISEIYKDLKSFNPKKLPQGNFRKQYED